MTLVPESLTTDATDILLLNEVNFSYHRLPKYISLAIVLFSSVSQSNRTIGTIIYIGRLPRWANLSFYFPIARTLVNRTIHSFNRCYALDRSDSTANLGLNFLVETYVKRLRVLYLYPPMSHLASLSGSCTVLISQLSQLRLHNSIFTPIHLQNTQTPFSFSG